MCRRSVFSVWNARVRKCESQLNRVNMFHCASGSVSTFFFFFYRQKIGWRSLSLVSFSIQCCAPTVRRMKAAFSVCVGKWRIDRSAPLPAAGSRTINTGPGVRGLHCLYNVESIYQAVCIGFGSREIKQNKEVCLVRRRRKSHLGRLLRKAISCSPRSYIRRAKYVYRLSFLVCGGSPFLIWIAYRCHLLRLPLFLSFKNSLSLTLNDRRLRQGSFSFC